MLRSVTGAIVLNPPNYHEAHLRLQLDRFRLGKRPSLNEVSERRVHYGAAGMLAEIGPPTSRRFLFLIRRVDQESLTSVPKNRNGGSVRRRCHT